MQPRGGFIQDKEGFPCRFFLQFARQLHPLRFSARQRCGTLPQFDIGQADILQRLQLVPDPGNAVEEYHGFLHRHIQDIRDRLVLVFHLQCLFVVPLPVTGITGDIHIRQEVHGNPLDSIPLA